MAPKKPKTIDIDYYQWLISQIETHEPKTYLGVLELMHNTEFVWFVPNDDNRVNDGLNLRSEYYDGMHGRKIEDIMNLGIMEGKGATVLEVLIALSRRIAFTASGEATFWAWQLMHNLGLHRYYDPLTERKKRRVVDILDALIWRTYESDGRGGFFPLNQPPTDQTKLEIWYQMNLYAMEIKEP